MPMPNENMEGSQPMPDGGPEVAPEGGGEAPNPVTSALKTIAAFIGAQQEKGSPQASQMMEAFKGLLQSFGAGGQAGPEEAPQESPAGGPEAQPMERGAMPMNAGRGAMPM